MGRLVSSFLELISSEYKTKHGRVGQYLHWDTDNFIRRELLNLFPLKKT